MSLQTVYMHEPVSLGIIISACFCTLLAFFRPRSVGAEQSRKINKHRHGHNCRLMLKH